MWLWLLLDYATTLLHRKAEKGNMGAKKVSDKLSWHILLMSSQNRVKMEMSPSAFKPKCVL